MTRSVNITASSYAVTENVPLTLSGTGLSVGTAAGYLRLTIVTTDNLFTAGAGTTGVNIEFDPGYPDFGNYLDLYGTATEINDFLGGVGGAYLVFTPIYDDPTPSAVLELVVYDDESTDPFVRDYVESGRNDVLLEVTPVNDCPVFIDPIPLNFPSRLNDPVPSGGVGTSVANLLLNAVDVDSADVGMAVISLDTSNGVWYHRITSTWVLITAAPSTSASLLLPRTARLYFKPNTGFEGTIANAIVFRAWDQTTGTAGSTANTTTNGGSTAFSPTTDSADITMDSVDVTLSIAIQANNSGEGVYFYEIKTAYISLFSNSNFYSTYVDPLPNKRLIVSFFEFADGVRQCFNWYLVDSQVAANALAGLIDLNVDRTLPTSRLNVGQAIELASGLMANSGYNSVYQIINFCADGNEIPRAGTTTAADAATTALSTGGVDAINGITVDYYSGANIYEIICPVINEVLDTSPTALQLSNYNNPVGQPGFVITALSSDGFTDGSYQTALEDKVFAETIGSSTMSGIVGSSSSVLGSVRLSATGGSCPCSLTYTVSSPLTFIFPVQEVVKTPVSRTRSLPLGDGYKHVSPDGINTLKVERNLKLRPLRKSDADTFESTLNGLNGDWFYWTPLGELEDKFRLLKLQRDETASDGNAVTLTLTVEKVYAP